MKTTLFFKSLTSTFIIGLLVTFALNAQGNYSEFSGKVVDGKTNKALELSFDEHQHLWLDDAL